jgi:putative flippase GtrA
MYIFKNRKQLFAEFIRYVFVGGFAFVIDFSVLYVFKEFILPNGIYALYLATGLGFTAGLAINYLLSITFVFTSVKGTKAGKSIKDIIVFALVGIIGLFLTELGMFLGTEGFKINYLLVKVIVTILVLCWNYTARKVLIFQKGVSGTSNPTESEL